MLVMYNSLKVVKPMSIDDSLLEQERINLSCNACDYTFKFNYADLKPEESLVFCPLCYTEKMISSKEEITSYLINTINNILVMDNHLNSY